MNPSIKDKSGKIISILDTEEVIQLHSLLSNHPDILKITEPVSPIGVKSEHLLESAVSRQHTGSGTYFKYDSVYSNCATLVYGLTKNHAFHNGNKRAAFLCMIKHLYKNGLVLKFEVSNDEVYDFLKAVASNGLKSFAQGYDKRLYNYAYKVNSIESDINFMARWIQKNTVSKHDADRPVKWKYIIAKLDELGIKAEEDDKASKICLSKSKKSFLGLRIGITKKCYPCISKECNKRIIKQIRKDFGITHQDGFDFLGIYNEETFLSEEIVLFKKAIYKLSKT
ncbi:type II toxin-antitoxin system death-on-curing family toxin [Cesiribacter andamanensis]|uniref:Death-on-curing family protein n=1 Tax=Cesiribacter andamanensis AMV16 TaxID=1279009 RepID=M7NSG9_9BACT|nr:type II toxin-antitoxin system death-on-curing family toxin [Cesiribacter andamanensis]EMR01424.1 death-on-curing family protein [Cesiribacter andamanensis AMV16]